ncbi:MAG TPA: MFS transporter [Myxococcota bacterium]|jgi:GPH family glycoside/pentoside/hexuronide:cation symporter|nr:MFS transporter [Myxococcota bacterium]
MSTLAAKLHLRLRTKLAYGVGAYGYSVANTMLMLYFNFFLTDVLRLPPLLAGVVQLVRNAWVAVNDPVIGMLTDRTRSRLGRRRSWMLFAFIPYGVLFAALWQHPPTTTPWGTVAWLIGAVFLYDVATTAVWVPYNALTPEITEDYDERTSLTAWRMVLSMLGGLVVGGAVEPLLKALGDATRGFSIVGWAAGAMAALPFFWVVLGVRERWSGGAAKAHGELGMIDMFRVTLRNRAFLAALLVYVLAWVCIAMASAMFVPFLTHWMHMGYAVVLFTVQASAMIIGVPAVVWLSKRIGKKGAYAVGIAFWAVVQTGMVFLSPAHAPYAVVLAALAGIGLGTAHVMPWSMVPDCIELDELETGQRREGAYYGVMACVEKIGTAAALAGLDVVLQVFGYVGGAAVQTPRALWALRVLMGPAPAALLLLSIVAVMFYPLSKARHDEVRRVLGERRAAAAVKAA